MSGQPGALVLEHAGVAGSVSRPGERDHRDTMVGAALPGSVGLQIGRDVTQIQRPPPPAPRLLLKDHPFDHRALDTEQLLP